MAQQLQQNTVYLTDDFVQAMNSPKPAQISKFMLLCLPDWRENDADAMYVDSAELGITETSPNIVLPAIIEQYWFNLCAHARKLHASIESGDVIEDFAEQAFWKMLLRLTNFDAEQLQSLVAAEVDNVIVHNNSVDGVNFLQVTLSIAAGLTQQSFQFEASKPSYLYTYDKVPAVTTPQTLYGNLTALYDEGVPYYDLASNKCLQAKLDSELGTQLNYNAILLFYDNAGTQQVAGIYFPNQFIEVGDRWTLPVIQPNTNTTIGYEINIAINATGSVEYIASNPSLSQGNLAFAQMYKKMQSANLQLTAFANKIAALELQVNNIANFINAYSFAKIQTELDSFKKQLATHFGGAISTDRLLDLFIATKQSAGQLSLSLHMSDLSKAVLGQQITVHGQGLGQYRNGDVIELGTSLNEILRKMLDDRTLDPYIQPVVLSLLDETQVRYVHISELGDSLTTRHSWAKHDAGDIVNRIIQRYIANGAVEYLDITPSGQNILLGGDVVVDYVPEGIMRDGHRVTTLQKVIQQVQFAEGEPHYYSTGEVIPGQIQAGTVLSNFYVVPKNYVIILHEDSSSTIESVVNSFANMTHQVFDAMTVPTDELSIFNMPTNTVSYIIQVASLDSNPANPAYAELGLNLTDCEDYDNGNADASKQGIVLQGMVKRYARIIRIENWDGIIDLQHVQPVII